eukprot:TRINITY_DN6940_c0_g1_i1.p1 TRINITY_DN6940_c0_g1~~TRINITY_DN6940_c0_g1_i1.p1  ORF type:complete len:911 (+),score=269.97 TRINITY_DN6940_c0_g1_i1:55-2787(+)
MVKTYLKYELVESFGVISSANALIDATGRCAVSASLESISIWSLKKKEKLRSIGNIDIKAEVTYLALSGDNITLAAGYSDGVVRLWDFAEGTLRSTLTGHRAAVTTMHFSKDGGQLVTGSKDTEIIIWDVVSETGVVKLRGHRDQVTCCKLVDSGIGQSGRKLISASRDGLVKIWDVDTQHCIQTLVGHRNPVTSIAVHPESHTLVSGCTDGSLRFWKLGEFASELRAKAKQDRGRQGVEDDDELYAVYYGQVIRTSAIGKDHVGTLRYSVDGSLLACQSDKQVEFFSVLSEPEANKRQKRRVKRRKTEKKTKIKKEDEATEEHAKADDDEESQTEEMVPTDEYVSKEVIVSDIKIKSFDFNAHKVPHTHFLCSMQSNSLCLYKMPSEAEEDDNDDDDNSSEKNKTKMIAAIEYGGHSSDIKAVSLSYDDSMIVTCSSQYAKIYNTKSRKCIRTLDVKEGVCAMFVPGDLHVIIGTKSGDLEIIEVGSGKTEKIEAAHGGCIWSICINPNGKGFASASADKSVKLWEFQLPKPSSLKVVHSRTLQVETDAFCVKISPNSKMIAVSLLDNTVKVYHLETLKFFLSLYGHRLPVMTLSISSDSNLLVTGSADKNIKIWGLDFGDCHKSIFAHDDSIMQVAFVPFTHYVFTCGKDKLVKYWDADKFEHVQTLRGHQSEVWGMCVSSNGKFVISVSHDRSIRMWGQTDEQLFLEEEKENELDTMFEESLLADATKGGGDDLGVTGETEHTRATRPTTESSKGSDRILEALTFMDEPDSPLAAALVGDRTLSEYVLHVMTTIGASELEEALLILPFANLRNMCACINDWLNSESNIKHTEIACRTLFFLLSIHQKQLSVDRSMLPLLLELNKKAKDALSKQKRVIGFNKAALVHIRRELEQTAEGSYFRGFDIYG